ncbi:hypothetical protein BFG51_04295 [Dietzia alimentaria]|uniref:DUF6338 family protein n=1 Tax=Dietzia TaxID=37914 RepID=UPI00084907AC|nr:MULTISPECIES: DUF6338 family protein [Dietzia]MCZ4657421.1 DUF6338 family protein [Dietzia kunjamensis]ODQ93034.1 hypothetical protein BFG51_04295 [Dietzia alimentaria]
MALPQTLFQVIAILLLVVPGIVFTAVRRYLRGPGPDEKDFSVRLIHAVAASAVFDCLYLIVAGPWIVSRFAMVGDATLPAALEDPRATGATVLVLAVGIPALTAGIFHVRFRRGRWPFMLVERRHSTPTAWDYAAPARADCYVRIYTSDGKWVGGYMPQSSGFVSTYPELRDIFIPQQWEMSPDGEFLSPIEGSQGIYVPLIGPERVEWVASGPGSTATDASLSSS